MYVHCVCVYVCTTYVCMCTVYVYIMYALLMCVCTVYMHYICMCTVCVCAYVYMPSHMILTLYRDVSHVINYDMAKSIEGNPCRCVCVVCMCV